jgi:hypothetical protein
VGVDKVKLDNDGEGVGFFNALFFLEQELKKQSNFL